MNWKYKQIDREIIFHESPEAVAKAARAALAESLDGWELTETADGFEAKGSAFSHSEIAKFHIETDSSGTKITARVLVQRAGLFGFMLFDFGGFYSSQIRRWFENIERHLHQNDLSAPPAGTRKNTAASKFAIGCFGLIFAIFAVYWLVQSVYAVIALYTGSLYLMTYKNAHAITINGIGARIGAGIILALDAFVIYSIFRKGKKEPQILYPNERK